jgi:hypothetical protein
VVRSGDAAVEPCARLEAEGEQAVLLGQRLLLPPGHQLRLLRLQVLLSWDVGG